MMRRIIALLRSAGISAPRAIMPIALTSAIASMLESVSITIVIAFMTNAIEGGPNQLALAGRSLSPAPAAVAASIALVGSLLLQLHASRSATRLSGRYVNAVRSDVLSAFGGARFATQQTFGTARLTELTGVVAYQASLLPLRAATTAAAISAAAVLAVAAVVFAPVVALAVIASGGCVGALMRRIGRRAARSAETHLSSQASLNTALADWADLHEEYRVMGVESRALHAVTAPIDGAGRDLAELRHVLESNGVAYRTAAVAWMLAIAFAAHLIELDDAGTAVIAVALLVRAVSYVQQAIGAAQIASEAAAAADRLRAAHAELMSSRRPRATQRPSRLVPIEIRKMSCALGDGSGHVLRNVNVTIGAGDRVAIIGPTGAGKSTLIAAVLGLIEPTSGHVLLGGVSPTELAEETRQVGIGFASQRPALTAGDILSNVSMCRDIEHLRIAELGNILIPDITGGIVQRLGPRGAGVSGGQAQRIALMRALVADPELIVLDEPTGAVDHETERRIVDMLRSAPDRSTMLIVTHRPGPLSACNRFLVVRDGDVAEVHSEDDARAALEEAPR